MQPIPFFENQSVRDLAWACFSSNLIDDYSIITKADSVLSCQIPLTIKRQRWLKDLDLDPTPLLEHLLQVRSPRLGIYYESLWQFFITQDDEFEFIASNLQINKNNKTQGEFDLIFKNKHNGQYTHLELAIKFYLNYSLHVEKTTREFDADLHYWIGPNVIDRLDKKISRLLNHQIRLADTNEAKIALKELNVYEINKKIALKGMLFYPVEITKHQRFNSENPSIKQLLVADHAYGHWTNAGSFSALGSDDIVWKKINRKHWISPACYKLGDTSSNLLNSNCMATWLNDYFSSHWQPVLISAMKKQGDFYIEQQRYFITADTWPMKNPTTKY